MDSTDEREGRRGFDLAEKVFVLGVLALVAAPVLKRWFKRYREISYRENVQEPTLDKTLKDSYPASDPPASQYYDIPTNRH